MTRDLALALAARAVSIVYPDRADELLDALANTQRIGPSFAPLFGSSLGCGDASCVFRRGHLGPCKLQSARSA